jgi:hypothetical protein
MQEYARVFQEAMGVATKEKNTERYMAARTKAKTTILNPTSLVPVFPSASTVTKQHNLSMSTAREGIREKVALKHMHEELPLISPLLPRKLQAVIATTKAQEQQVGAAACGKAGSDHQGHGGHQGSTEGLHAGLSHAHPEFKGTWEEAGLEQRALACGPKMSTFERRVSSGWLLRCCCCCLHRKCAAFEWDGAECKPIMLLPWPC